MSNPLPPPRLAAPPGFDEDPAADLVELVAEPVHDILIRFSRADFVRLSQRAVQRGYGDNIGRRLRVGAFAHDLVIDWLNMIDAADAHRARLALTSPPAAALDPDPLPAAHGSRLTAHGSGGESPAP